MFDKVKEMNRMRKTQTEIQKQLEQIFVTYEKSGVKLVVRGDRKIEKIEIDGNEDKRLKEMINDAFKEVNKKVEKQMRGQLQDLGLI
jgi:DNA-binding protein YbaB